MFFLARRRRKFQCFGHQNHRFPFENRVSRLQKPQNFRLRRSSVDYSCSRDHNRSSDQFSPHIFPLFSTLFGVFQEFVSVPKQRFRNLSYTNHWSQFDPCLNISHRLSLSPPGSTHFLNLIRNNIDLNKL
jgi:hypothetical protein